MKDWSRLHGMGLAPRPTEGKAPLEYSFDSTLIVCRVNWTNHMGRLRMIGQDVVNPFEVTLGANIIRLAVLLLKWIGSGNGRCGRSEEKIINTSY